MPRGSPTLAQLRDEIEELRAENEFLQSKEKALRMVLNSPQSVEEDLDSDEELDSDDDEDLDPDDE
jgi:prefoldin subunit 5